MGSITVTLPANTQLAAYLGLLPSSVAETQVTPTTANLVLYLPFTVASGTTSAVSSSNMLSTRDTGSAATPLPTLDCIWPVMIDGLLQAYTTTTNMGITPISSGDTLYVPYTGFVSTHVDSSTLIDDLDRAATIVVTFSTTSSTIPTASTSSKLSTTMTPSSGSGLSTAAKVDIGAGVPLGILVVLGVTIAFLFFRHTERTARKNNVELEVSGSGYISRDETRQGRKAGTNSKAVRIARAEPDNWAGLAMEDHGIEKR